MSTLLGLSLHHHFSSSVQLLALRRYSLMCTHQMGVKWRLFSTQRDQSWVLKSAHFKQMPKGHFFPAVPVAACAPSVALAWMNKTYPPPGLCTRCLLTGALREQIKGRGSSHFISCMPISIT